MSDQISLTRELTIDPSTTAILAIDLQNGFCHVDGSISKGGGDVSLQAATIPHIRRLVEAGRERGILDVWTKQEHYADDVTKARHQILPHTLRWGRANPTALTRTWDAEFMEEIEDLTAHPGEVVVKHRFSGFFDTRLDTLLRMKGITTLIVTGVSTTHCVETSVRDAYQKDYDVIIPAEAVAALTKQAHDASLWMMDRFFAKVMPLDDVLRLVKGEAVSVDFAQGWYDA